MDLFGEAEIKEENKPEELSEPENIQELLPPRQSSICLGHNDPEQKTLRFINEQRMPHALILSGPEGIGKATFAFRLARFLLTRAVTDPNQDALFGAEDGDQGTAESLDVSVDNPVHRRVSSGGHADLFVVKRKLDEGKGTRSASLDVAEIRKIAPFLRLSASEGGWRVVVVDDADLMNRNAQNAILKVLEEPPANVLIMLVTHRIGALIPTIRSRAQVLEFQSLNQENFQKLLQMQGHHLPPEDMNLLMTFTGGSIGSALKFLEEGGLDSMEQILKLFEDYPEWRSTEIHKLADTIGRAGQDHFFLSFQKTMRWISSEILASKARGKALPAVLAQFESCQEILKSSNLQRLTKIYDDICAHFDLVNRANLERRGAVLQAFRIFNA